MAGLIGNDFLDEKAYKKLIKKLSEPISKKRRAELEKTSKLFKTGVPKIDTSEMYK